MDRERTVQIVLGEAERTGILRFVLEGEGFDIVGLASSDQELERVMAGARPSVIVLDGGISAVAALEARERANGASLVVVWPDGVAAVLAEERVDPHLVMEDLGDAVRRASHRADVRQGPVRIPDLLDVASPIEARRVAPARQPDDDPPEPARPGRHRSRVLVAVATWIMVLTTLTAIAVAVPNALDLFVGDRTPRRSTSPAQGRRPDGAVDTGSRSTVERSRTVCDAGRGADARTDRARHRDAHPVRANGCPPDRGSNAGGNQGQRGKPDDPGSKSSKDEAAGKVKPGNRAGGNNGKSDSAKAARAQAR
jgi:hypothetical protein